MAEVIFKVENLSKHFVIRKSLFSRKKTIHALKQVNFEIRRGESLGLIGESGSGKTTLANILLGLLKPSKGKVYLFGTDITHFDESKLRPYRSKLQIIFQYTHSVLDPKMTIEALLAEPLKIHKIVSAEELDDEINRLLGLVGLTDAERKKYPTQLSGGQNQRILIARAIATRPEIIICDEPVSALDVSVQGQILNLLLELKKTLNLTYVFITHDLNAVKHISDRLAIMYQGEIVEMGETHKILNAPKSAYGIEMSRSLKLEGDSL